MFTPRSILWSSCMFLFTFLTAPPQAQEPQQKDPQPVQLTAEEDHQRIMDELHITALRRGPDGNPTSPNAANFEESKVAPDLQTSRSSNHDQRPESHHSRDVVENPQTRTSRTL